MSEGRRLFIDIIPRIDTKELEASIRGAFANVQVSFQQAAGAAAPGGGTIPGTPTTPIPVEVVNQPGNNGGSGGDSGTSNSSGSPAGSQNMKDLEDKRSHEIAGDTAEDTAIAAGRSKKGILDLLASKNDEDQKQRKKTMFYMEMGSKIVGQTQTLLKGSLTMGLNLVQNIYGKMKAASPLLQSVESLFQLAMTLFFMPLGNKLAEVMLPAVLRTLDAVIGIWDKFEGKSLGEMMSIALHEGMQILGGYINYIGSHLDEEKGLIGSVGKFLKNMGTVLMSQGEGLFSMLFGFVSWSFKWFPELLGTLVALAGVHYSLMTTQIAVTALASDWIGGMAAKAIALGPAVVGIAAGGVTSAYLRGTSAFSSKRDGGEYFEGVEGYAEGGYVPATPGGQLAIIGEGGEGEYVVPESKMKGVGGTITNNFYIEGVTSEELGRMITDKINEQISLSRIRGGF